MTATSSRPISLPEPSRSWKGLSIPAKLFIAVVVITGLATLIYGGIHQSSKNPNFRRHLDVGAVSVSGPAESDSGHV